MVRGSLLALGIAATLALAPATAAAKSFELPEAAGDVLVRADADGILMVGFVGRGARILAPASAKGITCIDGRPLQRCVKLKRGPRGNEWRVLRPVKLLHEQASPFAISILGAAELRSVAYMGTGSVALRGRGRYSVGGDEVVVQSIGAGGAGEAEFVTYSEADRTVSVTLSP